MSNILIIKHGSLGDLIQANGAIKDIKKFYPNRKVFLLTTQPYSIFMSECPYLDGVLIDSLENMKSSWNLTNEKYNLNISFNRYYDFIGKPFKEILQSLGVEKKNFYWRN